MGQITPICDCTGASTGVAALTPATEIAYAKINLALHVRARRADGYHELETAFAFCAHGDLLSASLADTTLLTIDGPFAKGLCVDDNLVLSAARAIGVPAHIHLTKNLPVASGIGGGSADAAATLRLLAGLSGRPIPSVDVQRQLGADVPACVLSRTARGEGVGELLTPLAAVTGTPVLLVNPRTALSTATVFRAWDGEDRGVLANWRDGRNDLEAPARRLVPVIGDVLDWLAARDGVTTFRMSGSGATCFALFASIEARNRAAADVPAAWWHMASVLR